MRRGTTSAPKVLTWTLLWGALGAALCSPIGVRTAFCGHTGENSGGDPQAQSYSLVQILDSPGYRPLYQVVPSNQKSSRTTKVRMVPIPIVPRPVEATDQAGSAGEFTPLIQFQEEQALPNPQNPQNEVARESAPSKNRPQRPQPTPPAVLVPQQVPAKEPRAKPATTQVPPQPQQSATKRSR